MLNKSVLINYNKNKNIIDYVNIIEKYFPNFQTCRICNNAIFYYDSTFRIHNGEITLFGKSFLSKKTMLNNNYYLTVCEKCLSIKYPEYNTLNKSRVFNRICDITNFAFNIPDNISKNWKQENYSITLKTLITKHGEKEGIKKWENYCNNQSLSNKFEYKKEKYGWTEEEFDKYNKSRSVTLKNLIKKNGEKNGLKIWNIH